MLQSPTDTLAVSRVGQTRFSVVDKSDRAVFVQPASIALVSFSPSPFSGAAAIRSLGVVYLKPPPVAFSFTEVYPACHGFKLEDKLRGENIQYNLLDGHVTNLVALVGSDYHRCKDRSRKDSLDTQSKSSYCC